MSYDWSHSRNYLDFRPHWSLVISFWAPYVFTIWPKKCNVCLKKEWCSLSKEEEWHQPCPGFKEISVRVATEASSGYECQPQSFNTDSTRKCHREAKRIVSPTSVRWRWLQKPHLQESPESLGLEGLQVGRVWKIICRLGLELPWQGNSAPDRRGPLEAKWKLTKEYLRTSELERCGETKDPWCGNLLGFKVSDVETSKSRLGYGNMNLNDQWSTLRRTMPTLLSEIVKRATWTDLKLL